MKNLRSEVAGRTEGVVHALRCVLLILLCAGVSAGCMPSLESTEPPRRSYWLEPVAIDDGVPTRVRVNLVPGLNSDHIWVLEPDQRLNYYAGAAWVDNLQPLLESLLRRSLNSAGTGVDAPRVEVSVERFFALSTGAGSEAAPEVVIRARLLLTGSPDRICTFDRAERATSGRLRDIVAAHQRLLDELAREVSRFAGSDAGDC